MVLELLFGLSSLEEEVAEPDLGQVSLVLVGGVDLLHSIEGLCFEVEALPDLGEASSAELFASQIALDEGLVLEDQLVMGFLVALVVAASCHLRHSFLLFDLSLVAVPPLILPRLPLARQSPYRLVDQLLLRIRLVVLPTHPIPFQQLTASLQMRFVPSHIVVEHRLTAPTPLLLLLLPTDLEILQLLDVYVEVNRPVLLLAHFRTLSLLAHLQALSLLAHLRALPLG